MQAGVPSADGELRFVLAATVREQLLAGVRGTIARRLERFTGHTVLVHSEAARLFADLPRRALVELERRQRGDDTLQKLFIPARLEFKVVDDEDRTLARVTPLPPGVTLEWDRYQGPGGALVTAPYLTSSDGQALRGVIRDVAPAERVFAIGRGADAAVKYRTFLLHERAGLTGEYVRDARVAFDRTSENPRPYVSLRFNERGARLFGSLTAGNVSRRLAIVLDGEVDSAPIIQNAITEGVCSINLGGAKRIDEMLHEAKDLSLLLKSGALAAPVRLISAERIPPRR
jgi:preprotein translocase subunit SecD